MGGSTLDMIENYWFPAASFDIDKDSPREMKILEIGSEEK